MADKGGSSIQGAGEGVRGGGASRDEGNQMATGCKIVMFVGAGLAGVLLRIVRTRAFSESNTAEHH